MRARSIVVGVCSALILLAGAFATKAISREGSAASNTTDPGRERLGGLGFNKLDRGNTRTLWTFVTLDPETFFVIRGLNASEEMDCTSINISLSPSGAVPAGYYVNSYIRTVNTYPGGASLTVPNTYFFTYSPPLRLRSGDQVYFASRGAALPPGVSVDCEITLHGFIPAASEVQGMMVQ